MTAHHVQQLCGHANMEYIFCVRCVLNGEDVYVIFCVRIYYIHPCICLNQGESGL